MALVKCPECGNQVSDRAAACPRCGFPLQLAARPQILTTTGVSARNAKIEGPNDASPPQSRPPRSDVGCLLLLLGPVLLLLWGITHFESEAAREDRLRTEEEIAFYTANANERRRAAVDEAISGAAQVLDAPSPCAKPSLPALLVKLERIARTDPRWAEASALLKKAEPCRKVIDRNRALAEEKALAEALRRAEGTAKRSRLDWAYQAEKEMLKQGMEVDFVVSGKANDLLTVNWILMSKVAVFKITNDASIQPGSFLANMKGAGFKRVTFTDGYDYSVTYRLQ